MDVLKIFLLGLLFVYILQVFDLLLQLLTSYISILITKCNVKINELGGDDKVDDNYRVGFHYESACESEFEVDGDYIDKGSKNKKSRGKL